MLSLNLISINIRIISLMSSDLLMNLVAWSSNHLNLRCILVLIVHLLVVELNLVSLVLLVLASNEYDVAWIGSSIVGAAMWSLLVWSSEAGSASRVWVLSKVEYWRSVWFLLAGGGCDVSSISLLTIEVVRCHLLTVFLLLAVS